MKCALLIQVLGIGIDGAGVVIAEVLGSVGSSGSLGAGSVIGTTVGGGVGSVVGSGDMVSGAGVGCHVGATPFVVLNTGGRGVARLGGSGTVKLEPGGGGVCPVLDIVADATCA